MARATAGAGSVATFLVVNMQLDWAWHLLRSALAQGIMYVQCVPLPV